MTAPQTPSPAPRADADDGAIRVSLTGTSDSSNPAAPRNFAAVCLAKRYRLPIPVATLVVSSRASSPEVESAARAGLLVACITARLPSDVCDVVVLADGDEAGEAAAQHCASRWRRQGRRVRIARLPHGMDFNDMLLGRVGRSEGDRL